ncbi:methyltransferase [Nonomuraea soli]|uniref:SAM-dependent methyltransferase n=1 Tax=Nonomuraea soli TaxID=1032476 RepID=A0A7W0HTP6_9ACTN|nr:methyltransferase [Nonomuraea soli]MBA2894926.1 SAM-dependent methyltransferase [Nonomuraea soli]
MSGYAELARMAFGAVTTQILHAAVRLGLPEALRCAPAPLDRLARDLGADPGTLARLLAALTALGVTAQPRPGHYTLTDLGQPLRADHPRSMRSGLLLLGDGAVWQAWGTLADSVRTGATAFDQVHGRPLFDHLAADPALARIFNTAMREGTEPVAADLAAAVDLTGARTVVDVGGGDGTLLAALLAALPRAHGILLDTAAGAADSARTLRGVADRCTVETGDFFTAVPSGDLMTLKGILHDWDDERCALILRACRTAIEPGGRLLVLEPVLPSRQAVMSDIAMLVYTGGRERDGREYRRLLSEAGFELCGVSRPLGGTQVRALIAKPA